MINKNRNNKGFTLVEVLVVIAIIGILVVVAVPALFKNINKSKIAKLESTYNAVKSATLSYYADKNKLPQKISDLVDNGYIEGAIDDANMQAQTGGIYKLYVKDDKGEIKDTYGNELKSRPIDKDGNISSTYIKLQEKGDLFLVVQGFDTLGKSMFINKDGIKKLCKDIGNENVYSFYKNIGAASKTNELSLKIIGNE